MIAALGRKCQRGTAGRAARRRRGAAQLHAGQQPPFGIGQLLDVDVDRLIDELPERGAVRPLSASSTGLVARPRNPLAAIRIGAQLMPSGVTFEMRLPRRRARDGTRSDESSNGESPVGTRPAL
jgi:hypothetical protein